MEKYTRKNNKKIKVGVFSVEDLNTDVFSKALDKKSKETGLTNIDLKAINKDGKTFIELYLISNKSDNDVKIKDWYMKNYPTDDLGEELNNNVTFEDMWNEDYKKYNVYQVMGVGDSVIRERLFEHLAEIKGVSYDVVYKKLFLSDGFYANGGGIGQVEHFTLDKDKLNEDAKWYADRIKSGQMSTTKKSIEERIEEYKKDLFLLEIGRKKPSNIIGTGYKGNAKKMANTWLLQEIYKDTKILELIGDNYSNGGGVGLTDKQKKIIDLNDNDIIDSEDFKLLRSSMNGAWRNEHEHVNSTSRKNGKVIDYEVRYARKHNPSRKGYKGKSNFEDGGAVNLNFRNFTLNELSKSLPQDVSIMWLFQKKPEKFIRIYDKEWNKYASKHWTISDYGQLELTKGSENLYIDLKVYEASENAPEVEYFVTIYTKDNHNGLKEFSKNLIQKFATGGGFEKLSNSVAKRYEGDAVAPKYQRMYGKRYDKEEAKEVGNKVAGKVKAMQMQNKKAFGGLFGKNIPSISKPHYPNFEDKQVMLKNGEWVQVLDQSGDTLMVISLGQIGTGASAKRVNISEVEMN